MSGDRGSGTSLGFSRGWVDLPLGRRQKLPDGHILELGSVGDTSDHSRHRDRQVGTCESPGGTGRRTPRSSVRKFFPSTSPVFRPSYPPASPGYNRYSTYLIRQITLCMCRASVIFLKMGMTKGHKR